MTHGELDELLAGISVYQDVVIPGQVVRRGERDCEARWSLIEPHLPRAGVLLDAGSNFGWFGLRATSTRPDLLVLSAEADERSARVQQAILEANGASRIMLVTRRAGAKMLQRLATVHQRFDAVFCLSILHWMPDHCVFLQALAAQAQRIFFEYPDSRELGVGSKRIRDEIGDFAGYLRSIFGQHTIRCLGTTPGLAGSDFRRAIWMVEAHRSRFTTPPKPRLAADAVMSLAPAWPLRSWWRKEWNKILTENMPWDAGSSTDPVERCQLCVTPHGLALDRIALSPEMLARFEQQLFLVPESGLFTPAELMRRRSRGLGHAVAGRLNALGRRFSFSR